ncbi:hypothetical protein A2454_06870 [Candidatus Peribacteria bacterium RIFOXYC2_FULL_55_14]|nr:MAG: hypothetical protein UY85_C0023G0010 [Candidatus Peribacteria bacterium GW2011_GWB1_54_5]OGJ74103.1 MAG: hypothetical protein A2217_00460 [Candidatus Peribacteria bacterium RIFOXYA2_FULL_55_28]OGJ75534.1 MAG: hypothetical protein A2384_01420 [Candidatus Peribacteria bacterium RIFOXYB1_FULL_54_35]OGJ76290.1 MAG: hypothetical protein A2327_00450 [Candidatus Peribacteria bacterium RIFOXYB2_FULL_54_17]OGJ78849.1 MAG: hypothetical protein A2424_05985 [Candidatus Peribacteria bacterium RIFOXY
MRKLSLKQSFVFDSALFLAALLLLASAFHAMEPTYSQGEYRLYSADEWQEYEYPFGMDTPEQVFPELKFLMRVGALLPSRFLFIPDDCVEGMSINRIALPAELFPLCDYWFGQTLDLSSYLRRGENIFQVKLKNDGGYSKLKISIAQSEPMSIFLRFLLLLATAVYLWRAGRMFCKKRSEIVLFTVFAASVFLRIYYFFITRYEVRGHDSEGHIEYIQYLLDHRFALPHSTAGWEFYHPPLYYYLSALWMRVDMMFTNLRHVLLRDLQIFSFLLTVGMLIFIFWTCLQLFPRREQLKERLFFLLPISFLPSFVYFTARINNDVLYQFFAFATLALILAWWKDPRKKYWFLCIGAVVLGLLSKSTTFILLPLVYACLLLRRNIRWKQKLLLGVGGLFIIGCLTGWFYALRFLQEDNTSIVQNLTHLSSGLAVDSSVNMLTEFNPVRVIKVPFNSSWGDENWRDHFWEYWVKSAFFGEYPYGERAEVVGSVILFLAMLLLPFLFMGFFSSVRKRRYETFPLWFTALTVLLAHAAYRQYAPFSSSQDFRYSMIVIVPFAYFLLVGIGDRSKPVRIGCYVLLTLLLVGNVIFIAGLPFLQK